MNIYVKSLILFLSVSAMACSGGGTNDDQPESTINLGTFEGSFQVVNVPQTELGFVFNARANFTKVADRFIMTVTGDDGLNRTFEGQITGEGSNSSFLMSLEGQTSPNEKIADGALSIVNDIASIEIVIDNDMIMLRETEEDTESYELAGTLRLGGNFSRTN